MLNSAFGSRSGLILIIPLNLAFPLCVPLPKPVPWMSPVWAPYQPALPSVSIYFRDYGLPSTDPWNNHKTTRYFAHIEARRRAQLRGFDEALLLNEFGNVVEASAHNLFWINDSWPDFPSIRRWRIARYFCCLAPVRDSSYGY